MLEVLDRHERELTALVKNTGVVFGALNGGRASCSS